MKLLPTKQWVEDHWTSIVIIGSVWLLLFILFCAKGHGAENRPFRSAVPELNPASRDCPCGPTCPCPNCDCQPVAPPVVIVAPAPVAFDFSFAFGHQNYCHPSPRWHRQWHRWHR
jgi:hypothetical protein